MKGIITQIQKNKAVVLNECGEFTIISNKNYTTGQKIEYKKSNNNKIYYMVASFILFVFMSFSGYSYYADPVSYMSVDINPSIQLEINRFNKVVNAKPLNEDAKDLLSTINVKNKDINDCIDLIIASSKSMGYLNETNNNVEIDIVSPKIELINDVDTNIKKYDGDGINVSVIKSNEDDLNLSNELGISIGRSKAIVEYTDTFGGDVKNNVSQLSQTPIGEIKKTIKENKESKKPEVSTQSENKTDDKKEKPQNTNNSNDINIEETNQHVNQTKKAEKNTNIQENAPQNKNDNKTNDSQNNKEKKSNSNSKKEKNNNKNKNE